MHFVCIFVSVYILYLYVYIYICIRICTKYTSINVCISMHVICMYPSTSLAARRTELIAASEAVEEAEGKAEKPPC